MSTLLRRINVVVIALMLQQPALAGKYALLIGANKYDSAIKMNSLSGGQDATALQEALDKAGQGWTTKLLTDIDDDKTYNTGRYDIFNILGIRSEVKDDKETFTFGPVPQNGGFIGTESFAKEDLLVVYIAGHGIQDDPYGEFAYPEFFIPTDAKLKEPGVLDRKSLVPLPAVYEALKRCGAGKIVLITDICRTDASTREFGWRGTVAGKPESLAVTPNASDELKIVELKSTQNLAPAYEMPGKNRGVFSFYLVQALSEDGSGTANANGDGSLDLGETFDHARRCTEQYVLKNFQKSQRPVIRGENYDWIRDTELLRLRVKKPVFKSAEEEGESGEEFNFNISAEPYPESYSAEDLPGSLALDAETGQIKGRLPKKPGTYKIKLKGRNSAGWGEGTLTLTVVGSPDEEVEKEKDEERAQERERQRQREMEREREQERERERQREEAANRLTGFTANGTIFRVMPNGAVLDPFGIQAGFVIPPAVLNSRFQIRWNNGTFTHLMADRAVVNIYPAGTIQVGNW